jgi:hypothetical protein
MSCACSRASLALGHAPGNLFHVPAPVSRLPHRRPACSNDGAPRQKQQDLRVAIIGAGIGGPVLAMLLKKHLGCTPVVFEQADAIREVGMCRGSQSLRSCCCIHCWTWAWIAPPIRLKSFIIQPSNQQCRFLQSNVSNWTAGVWWLVTRQQDQMKTTMITTAQHAL